MTAKVVQFPSFAHGSDVAPLKPARKWRVPKLSKKSISSIRKDLHGYENSYAPAYADNILRPAPLVNTGAWR